MNVGIFIARHVVMSLEDRKCVFFCRQMLHKILNGCFEVSEFEWWIVFFQKFTIAGNFKKRCMLFHFNGDKLNSC